MSNNFAVSSADIAKNIGKASSVMANAGNTLEETIGLNNRSIKTSLTDWEILRGLHTKLCW
nr:MAG TPA: minor tail protein [Caudoviricetes sp.]